jgi:hypothetical protein
MSEISILSALYAVMVTHDSDCRQLTMRSQAYKSNGKFGNGGRRWQAGLWRPWRASSGVRREIEALRMVKRQESIVLSA